MKIEDFCYIWQGKPLQQLTALQVNLAAPVDIRASGNDRAILLLHGFSSSPAVYRQLILAIQGKYNAIVCPALPGHGDSIEAFSRATHNDWLQAAEEHCEKLIKTYHKVDVLGLSLGGLLACHLSQIFKLNHLYLLAPAFDLRLNVKWALIVAKLAKKIGIKRLRNHAGNIHVRRFGELTYCYVPITAIIEILSLIKNYKFPPPTCPTDVFLGMYDKVVNNIYVSECFKDLPNVHYHWLPQSAHVLPLDGDLDIITEFIENQ